MKATKILIGGQALRNLGSDRYTNDVLKTSQLYCKMKGGKREGSGRPKKDTKPYFKRVPRALYDEIKELVEKYLKEKAE